MTPSQRVVRSAWYGCIAAALSLSRVTEASSPLPEAFRVVGVHVEGATAADRESIIFQGRNTFLRASPVDPENYRVEFELAFTAASGATDLALGPDQTTKGEPAHTWRVRLQRKPRKPFTLVLQPLREQHPGKWVPDRGSQRAIDLSLGASRPPPTRKNWWRIGVERQGKTVRVLFDGQVLSSQSVEGASRETLEIRFAPGAQVRRISFERPNSNTNFVPLPLGRAARRVGGAETGKELTVEGVPFLLMDGGRAALDLRDAKWPEWKRDPSGTREAYDSTPSHGDRERPVLWTETADYTTLHLLVSARREIRASHPGLSITLGAFGLDDQVRQYGFQALVPPLSDSRVVLAPVRAAGGSAMHVQIPLHANLTGTLPDVVQLAFNKELRLAVRQPDPSRFRYRPLGLPSNVLVWAATLERSPLQMEVTCDEPGHAFEDPALPKFRIRLTNVTDTRRNYTVHTIATHGDGHRLLQKRSGALSPHSQTELILHSPVVRRGYYDYRIELRGDANELLLEKNSSFVWLMPNTRAHVTTSPFGTWDFSGAHFTSSNPDLVGALYRKLGFRYGMFRFTRDERARAGVVQGREPVALGSASAYSAFVEKHPDAGTVALLLHEQAISRSHLHRVPDIFQDRGQYPLNAAERTRFQELFSKAETAA
ncbi:MAG TPA: hypothetical protein VIM73_15565, partial [Polyangiaceae bacterium]